VKDTLMIVSREKRHFDKEQVPKTGNAFVTESLPEYTIFCFFTACRGMRNSEVITIESDSCDVLSILAF
jgi:hypothetical protein